MKSIAKIIPSNKLVVILIIFYLLGFVGLLIPSTRDLFRALTPVTLLLSFTLLYLFHERYNFRFWILSGIIFSIGLILEIAGVETGILFGEYEYGPTLGPKLFHTPLIIGINWLMIVYCSLSIARRFVDVPYFRAIIAAIIMVVYDFALEPAAVYLDMWRWKDGSVPLQNYIAWLISAFLMGYIADHFHLPAKDNRLASPLFFIQIGFFILLDIWIFIGGLWSS